MRWLFLLAVALASALPASAIFMRPDLEKVPVARLAENLEKLAKEDPKKIEYALNLARTYAMAYSKKADELEIDKRRPNMPWLGFSPKEVPFAQVTKTEDKAKLKAAGEALQKALDWYAAALKIDAKNMTARIGQAWATEQAGKKDEAIKLYRQLIEDAWEQRDMNLRALGLTGETITTEAGGYLIPLLDAEKDKDEIAKLKERIAFLKKLPRPITPIAIPLQDGLAAEDLEDRNAAVKFDADGTGFDRRWTWITPKAAWLVYDPKGKGDITSGLQLFGNVTFRLAWSNGYGPLAALDDNRDGKLSGQELDGLALWHDANGNGIADPGEVKPLASHGIVAVNCQWEELKTHADRIAYQPKGVTFRNGTTRPTFDLILRSK